MKISWIDFDALVDCFIDSDEEIEWGFGSKHNDDFTSTRTLTAFGETITIITPDIVIMVNDEDKLEVTDGTK